MQGLQAAGVLDPWFWDDGLLTGRTMGLSKPGCKYLFVGGYK